MKKILMKGVFAMLLGAIVLTGCSGAAEEEAAPANNAAVHSEGDGHNH